MSRNRKPRAVSGQSWFVSLSAHIPSPHSGSPNILEFARWALPHKDSAIRIAIYEAFLSRLGLYSRADIDGCACIARACCDFGALFFEALTAPEPAQSIGQDSSISSASQVPLPHASHHLSHQQHRCCRRSRCPQTRRYQWRRRWTSHLFHRKYLHRQYQSLVCSVSGI